MVAEMLTSPPGSQQATPFEWESDLVPGDSSVIRSIAHAVVIKSEDLFFLSEADGSVPLTAGHGFGLYYHDCRVLGGYEVTIGGRKLEALVKNVEHGDKAVIGLSNPDLKTLNGQTLMKNQLEIKWTRRVSSDDIALYDTIRFHSLAPVPTAFRVGFAFRSEFEDVFMIRGLFQSRRGEILPPEWHGDALQLGYAGADDVLRLTRIAFRPQPLRAEGTRALFEVHLLPKETRDLHVSIFVSESDAKQRSASTRVSVPTREHPATAAVANLEEGRRTTASFTSDSRLLNTVMNRSMCDLSMLRSHVDRVAYFAAGVPWFVALFGRDSIITAMQTLAIDPRIAEETLRLLARYQGTTVDPAREEEPGKILHELRVGEMARLREVPHTPYYGTIDATPLWLILLEQHAAWTGRLDLFTELQPQVEAALGWLDRHGDPDGDGYLEYDCKIEKGLANQGWKDSGDCIVNRDGTLATPPIALVELQGYTYQAKCAMASLYQRAGQETRAHELLSQAKKLREAFNRDFWVADGYYALALHAAGKRQAAVLSSNAGHTLWSGIATESQARQTADHLMSPAMFSGWGIRTLSGSELAYNPMGYHLGTVWPHDNSMIANGFRRYGYDDEALRVFGGLMDAAMHFDSFRLPELFGGFHREDYGVPVNYPVACQPQAWAAGTIPYMVTTLLGLQPEAFEQRLRVVRPIFPENVHRMELRGIAVGAARASLMFERLDGRIEMTILEVDGELEIVRDS
jgi:glycogen debranching enzyme